MKAHLAKVSLALVSAVFILGCQDLGSGPVGPEGPQFDKEVDGEHGTIKPHGGDKGNEETATFTATFTLAGDSDDNQLPANLQTAFPGPQDGKQRGWSAPLGKG